jgi:hypothetical protein
MPFGPVRQGMLGRNLQQTQIQLRVLGGVVQMPGDQLSRWDEAEKALHSRTIFVPHSGQILSRQRCPATCSSL